MELLDVNQCALSFAGLPAGTARGCRCLLRASTHLIHRLVVVNHCIGVRWVPFQSLSRSLVSRPIMSLVPSINVPLSRSPAILLAGQDRLRHPSLARQEIHRQITPRLTQTLTIDTRDPKIADCLSGTVKAPPERSICLLG